MSIFGSTFTVCLRLFLSHNVESSSTEQTAIVSVPVLWSSLEDSVPALATLQLYVTGLSINVGKIWYICDGFFLAFFSLKLGKVSTEHGY